MCFNPIKIYNRKRLFRTGVDSAVVSVPCGKCAECLEQKQNDYVFRSWYELQKMKRNFVHVESFFLTLTFSKEFVPVVDTELYYPCDHFYKGNGWYYTTDVNQINFNRSRKKVKSDLMPSDTHYRRMVPDFSMIQKFFKKLRSRLERDCPHLDFHISYLCATELGKVHFRPHYHLILFVGCNNTFSSYTFMDYIKNAWTVSDRRRNAETGQFESIDVPIGRITNDRLFIDDKFKGQVRNDFDAIKYCCKYSTKDVGFSAGEKKQSSRLRLSLGYGMPDKDKDDFISENEYLQGFKFLPFGKKNEFKKFLIPLQYYQRKKLKISEYIDIFEKNARYVEDVKSYLCDKVNNPLGRYNEDCKLSGKLDVKKFLNSVRFDSSLNAACKTSRLIHKADVIFENMVSAFDYNWQPHLISAFEDMYGVSVTQLREFSTTLVKDDFLDYILNVRPWIYWRFKSFKYHKFAGLSEDIPLCGFPYRFFSQRVDVWSDVFCVDQYRLYEILFIFYEYYREMEKSIREDLIIYSKQAEVALIDYLTKLKHNEEFQSSFDTAGAMYSRNVVSAVERWCDPFTHVWHDFKSTRTSSRSRHRRVAAG